MKNKKRIYYLAHENGDTYICTENGKALQIKNGELTGRVEKTNLLKNSGYKYKWINI